MRRAIVGVLTTLLLAAGLVLAAPAPAHAEPPTDGTADCHLLQIVCNATDAVVGTAEGVIDPVVGTVQDAAGAVGGVVDFVQNPLGYLAAAVQGVALGFMGWIATMSNQATQPDLSQPFWLQAYKTGMGLGVILLGFVLLYEIVQVGRRKASGDELMETLSIWVPAFFAGIIFGPALAQFVINGSGYLVDGLVRHLTGFGGTDAWNSISTAAANTNWFSATGAVQALMALFVAIGVLVAAVVVFVSLCIQAVILYLATAVFAIGWVWIVTNRHRENAWKIPRLIIGIAFGKALLFLLLGLALGLATAATSFQGDGALRDFGLITMATIAMLLAAFAPLMLLRHAPVVPGTSTSRHTQDSMSGAAAGGRSAARGGSKTAQLTKTGHGKLSALAASRSDRKSSTPPGAPAGPGRSIDAPIPSPSGTSKASAKGGTTGRTRTRGATGRVGTTSPKAPDPKPASAPPSPSPIPAGSSGGGSSAPAPKTAKVHARESASAPKPSPRLADGLRIPEPVRTTPPPTEEI